MRTTKPFAALLTIASGAAVSVAAAAPLHFVDVTSTRVVQTVAEVGNNEKAVDLGDFDNDGDLDVLIGIALSDFGAKRNKLYRNDNGVMQEVTGTAIPSFVSTQRVTRVAFLRDYDGDGWADIYVINDANSNSDQLFINQHPGGVFTGYTEVFGLPGNGVLGASCSGVSEDLDGDGDIDTYIGNYPNSSQDKMIMNNGSGVFTDVTGSMVPSDQDYTVDVSIADMNNDGRRDLLISSEHDLSFIYYNNNNGLGSGPGDFRYAGSSQSFPIVQSEHAMEPADFNNDGLIDIYGSNTGGGAVDLIRLNTGIDANNKATFSNLTNVLPPSVTNNPSRKATVADFNSDGRIDVFVMKEGGSNQRPTLLRNTSVNGDISFVDWTEASAFPSGSTLAGWHSAAFDSNSDGDLDLFLGAFNNDHLFEQEPAPTFDAATLAGGVVPNLFDGSSAVINSSKSAGNTFLIENVQSGGFVSAIVTGDGSSDLILDVLSNGNILGSSNRGGVGVEEALQVNNLPAGSITVRVSTENIADLNTDAVVNGADLAILLIAFGTDGATTGTDFNNDGVVNGADLAVLLINWGAGGTGSYTLELVARSS